MKFLPLFVAGMLLVYSNVYAQSDRISSSVVLNNGDSLSGFVVDWKDKWPVREIQLTSFDVGTSKRYLVSDLNSIYLKTYDAYYLSREIPGNKNKVLLQLLIKGNLNLLKYIDDKKKERFFVKKGEGDIEELQSLQNLTSDCSNIGSPPIKNTERELSEFVQRYNSCFGGKSQHVTAMPKRKTIAGAFVGVGVAGGSLSGKADGSVVSPDGALGVYSTVIAPTVGISVEFRPTRATNPSRAGFQLSYQNFPTTSKEKMFFAMAESYKMSVSVVNVGGTYKYLLTTRKKTNFYLKGELNGVFVLSGETSRKRTASGLLFPTTSMGEFKKTGYSYGAGFGMLINDMFIIEARFKRTNTSIEPGGHVGFVAGEVVLGYLFIK